MSNGMTKRLKTMKMWKCAIIQYPVSNIQSAFAWVYWRTGRLWTTMLMHSVVNATSFLLLLVFHEMVG